MNAFKPWLRGWSRQICGRISSTVLAGTSIGAATTGFAKEKSTDAKITSGQNFDGTGIVKKIETGICTMEGAKWDLLTNVGQPTHLAAGNDKVAKMLDQVAGTKKRVRVEGTQVSGVECPHVKVDKVTMAK